MNFFRKYIGDLFLSTRFYVAAVACVLLSIISLFVTSFSQLSKISWFVLFALFCIDYIILFFLGKKLSAKRIVPDRLSNGDDNKITLQVTNTMSFEIRMEIIDELPEQFQKRDWIIYRQFKAGEQKAISYTLRPTERGEYHFGNIMLYAKTIIGIAVRRNEIEAETMAPVYPSYVQLRKYELLSQTTVQSERGTKRMRKIGHSLEFEQIKEYVSGDDIRTINWRATARRGSLMVNNYTDEKSQQVFCMVDKGRLMKMPFANMSLLDYAINSTLVLSNVCLRKQDKVGLITFSNKMDTILAADSKPIQQENILQLLYNERTTFKESDYEMLYMQIRKNIKQRSLLILFTNFESLSGLKRQLNYLRSIASHHLLLVIFFENTELRQLSSMNADSLQDVYIKTIAEKFDFEKRLIVKELLKHGILSVLTSPENLTVNIINKYIELKTRQAL